MLKPKPVAVALLAGFSFALAAGQVMAQANVLTAVKVATPPKLDGNASDAAWKSAKAVTVKLSDGANFGGKGATTATIKAVYSGDMLYMLVQYADPTNSFRRAPYQKQADGSWKQLKDPKDEGGDNNVYYEDKWAMIWSIGNSIKDFDKQGCGVTCHAGEPGKPYGNKYTASEGELGDIWHMKGVRTAPVGQIDNQYLDSTRFDKDKSPEAGRKSDSKDGGGYENVKLVDGKPAFMNKDGKPGNKGGTYYIKKGNEVAFNDSKFKAGDEVAAIMISPFTGPRGVIAVANGYANGQRTSEVARKLVTGSKTDVQFDDLGDTYYFGFAAFDNAQVRHAVHYDAITLKFAK
jgi:hypothetical protein